MIVAYIEKKRRHVKARLWQGDETGARKEIGVVLARHGTAARELVEALHAGGFVLMTEQDRRAGAAARSRQPDEVL